MAAGVSAIGFAGLLQGSPALQIVLMSGATLYLLWLAWTIASAPVGGAAIGDAAGTLTIRGAFLLGVANPKAYLAFASLMGAFAIAAPAGGLVDGAVKWALCVLVMVVVDLAWLGLGMSFGRIALSAPAERAFNLAMGAAILAACALSWL